MSSARQQAQYFLENEREFRLGVLPTEQAHPQTTGLSEAIRRDTAAGVRMLQAVDGDIPPAARRVFASREFDVLVAQLFLALKDGKHIFLSGCGATGRLCILLEAAWRRFWRMAPAALARTCGGSGDALCSLMTGGDYALIRSVEFFEDYISFGRHQIAHAGVSKGDVVVAVTEGGETSSVIGTAWQGVEAGAHVFFVFNNPAQILTQHVERSRAVINDARIVKLDLSSGPMAVAGSTRMQATTIELLVLGTALELALNRLAAERGTNLAESTQHASSAPDAAERATTFMRLRDDLAKPAAMQAITQWIACEEQIYARRGVVTYLADTCLLDIFTDTTERAPTFMLPSFRRCDDARSPRSWAFVKNPRLSTPAAWRAVLEHEPRCLDWTGETYRQLGAPERIWQNPPQIGALDLERFLIGNEPDPSRYASPADAVVLVLNGSEARMFNTSDDALTAGSRQLMASFPRRVAVSIGTVPPPATDFELSLHIACHIPPSPLCLWEHLAVKLVLNIVSTATMARLGRLSGNWMVHVEATNKKLIDRGTRIIMEFTGLSYEAACLALHETIAELQTTMPVGKERPSPVARTIERLSTTKAGHKKRKTVKQY